MPRSKPTLVRKKTGGHRSVVELRPETGIEDSVQPAVALAQQSTPERGDHGESSHCLVLIITFNTSTVARYIIKPLCN